MANALPPTLSATKGLVYYIKKTVKNPRIAFTFFYNRIPLSWSGIKPTRLILAGGERSPVYPCRRDGKTEILWAHSLDYDICLKNKNLPLQEKNTAVFLDEYYPFHPDYIYLGLKPPVTAEQYYPPLNRFFDRVEKELGLEIVIAEHPRSAYEKHPEYFSGRKRIKGNTANLVRECKLVLAHSSTALNYPNIYQKPVIFLTSRSIDASWLGSAIKAMACWFGKKPVFVDELETLDLKKECQTDLEAYKRYRQAYIKTDNSEDLLFWQIVANRLKSSDFP